MSTLCQPLFEVVWLRKHTCTTTSLSWRHSQANDKEVILTNGISVKHVDEIKRRRGFGRTDHFLEWVSSEQPSKMDRRCPGKEGVREGLGLGRENGRIKKTSQWQVRKFLRTDRRNAPGRGRQIRSSQEVPGSCWNLLHLHHVPGKLSSKFLCPTHALSFAPCPSFQSHVCYQPFR